MGIVDNFKSFFHSITTDDHYASYDSPYKNSAINNIGNTVGGGTSNSRLHELNRLATANSSSHSLIEGNNSNANGSRTSLSRNDSSTTVGYRPGLRSSNTNTSDLQLQNLSASGQPPLPSVDSLWDRIENWLEEEYPELEDNLNGGVTTADLNEFENDLGCGSLPVEVRQSYKRHDGQFRGGKPTGLIMGLTLLDLESIVEEYAIWAKVNQRLEKQQYMYQQQQHQQQQNQKQPSSSNSNPQPNRINNSFIANQKSIPPNAIQPFYAHRGWIPFAKDYCGNQVAIDLAPGPQGNWGQIIIFGRDYDTKLVVASSFQEFIFGYVTDLELGNFQIDQSEDQAKYGYLEKDDDFMIGDGEEEQGELCFYDRDRKEFSDNSKGKMSYLEVLKRRSLKKFGINNTDKFLTSFTPQRIPQGRPLNAPGTSSPLRSQSPKLSGSSNSNITKGSSTLINLDSTSKVALPKETLIDDEEKATSPQEKSDTKATTEQVVEQKMNTKSETTESKTQPLTDNVKQETRDSASEIESASAQPEEKEVQEPEQNNEEEEEVEEEEEEEKNTNNAKPLTKSQKKNQNKKAKKQQKQANENENEVEKVAGDLNEVEL